LTPQISTAADRQTDEQVKKLIEDIDDGYNRWKDGLEKRNLDEAVIKSAARTIDVSKFLDDFEKDIDLLKDRFKSTYAATDEVLAVLRRGSDVELRNRQQNLTPSSEWTAMGSKLGALAAAYGVPWPVENMNVQPGRLNDTELVTRLDQLEKSAKELRNEADKAAKANKSIDKTARESIKGSIQEFERTTKEVQERIKDDRPASTEVGQLMSQAKSMQGMLSKLTMSQAGGEAWSGVQSGIQVLAQAWGMGK
jgi:uncharacterized phage infection (PIP) family protein YhgE